MKIKLLYIGKEDSAELSPAVQNYVNKIKFYVPFEVEAIPYLKNTKLAVEEQKKQEGKRAAVVRVAHGGATGTVCWGCGARNFL